MTYKLYIFDLDNTLAPRNSDELSQTVEVWFRENRPERVAIATNQGGVGLRYWMQPRPEDEYDGFGDYTAYPSEADVCIRAYKIIHQIREITGGEVKLYMAFRYLSQKGNWSPIPPGRENDPEWSEAWRKPNPGMLLQAAEDFGVSPTECIFVGDGISQGSDEQAAVAAGMDYLDEGLFFGRIVTFSYRKDWVVEWLAPHERIGLKLEDSYTRFEGQVRDMLTSYHHVIGVEFDYFDGDYADFTLDEESTAVLGREHIARQIKDLDINRQWLVYESAEEHAEALANHPRCRYTVRADLRNLYGLSVAEASALVERVQREE